MTLVRRFLIISLVSVGPTAIAFGWMTARSLTTSMVQREELVTVRDVERVVSAHVPLASLRRAREAAPLALTGTRIRALPLFPNATMGGL